MPLPEAPRIKKIVEGNNSSPPQGLSSARGGTRASRLQWYGDAAPPRRPSKPHFHENHSCRRAAPLRMKMANPEGSRPLAGG